MYAPTARIYGALAAIAMFAAAPVAAKHRVWCSGVDMALACQQQYGRWYSHTYPDTLGGANSWACADVQVNKDERQPLDIQRYCVDNCKNGPSPYADPQGGGAFDWGCYYAYP